jgi:hypothetical protein
MRVVKNIGRFEINEDGDDVELNKDDVVVASYRPFRGMLAAGSVALL